MPCVLLVRVQRHGTVPPGSRQTVVAEVNGINKRTLRHDVRRQLALYRGEHTAVMHVRCSPLVAEHQEHHRPHRHSHALPLPVIGGAAADLVLVHIWGCRGGDGPAARSGGDPIRKGLEGHRLLQSPMSDSGPALPGPLSGLDSGEVLPERGGSGWLQSPPVGGDLFECICHGGGDRPPAGGAKD